MTESGGLESAVLVYFNEYGINQFQLMFKPRIHSLLDHNREIKCYYSNAAEASQ